MFTARSQLPVGRLSGERSRSSLRVPSEFRADLACRRERASGQSCIANLREIAGSKIQYAKEQHRSLHDTPRVSDLVGPTNYMLRWLQCKQGGTYSMGTVGEWPKCSIPEHQVVGEPPLNWLVLPGLQTIMVPRTIADR